MWQNANKYIWQLVYYNCISYLLTATITIYTILQIYQS